MLIFCLQASDLRKLFINVVDIFTKYKVYVKTRLINKLLPILESHG